MNGVETNKKPITTGVPQGSILGPFLFLIYSNDLPQYITHNKTEIAIFADDTSIVKKRRESMKLNGKTGY